MTDIVQKLQAIVGRAHVRPAGPTEAIRGVPARLVVEPATEQEVAAVLRCADDEGSAVIPRGGGTKLSWGNRPSCADLILSTARLSGIIEHAWADLTVTVQAGCAVSRLQETLARHGQRLALDPLWPERATVGGVLSTNDSGTLRLRYGGLRDLIIGVTLALADGTLATSGGRVVKNVAGYDLPKLATGALGTIGVITQAIFRLHPLARATRTLSIRPGSMNEAQDLLHAIQSSSLAHTALQVRLTANAAPEMDVLLEGTEEGVDAQEARVRELAGTAPVEAASPAVWESRQGLWLLTDAAVVKLSVLPSNVANTAATAERIAGAGRARWSAVIQASGIGWLRLAASPEHVPALLRDLRAEVERQGGSLVVLRQPFSAEPLDAWGNPGDALPVMRALKHQLDPHGTLNPGRFVGGI